MNPNKPDSLIDEMHVLINFAEVFPEEPLLEKKITDDTARIYRWFSEYIKQSTRYLPDTTGMNPLVLRVAVGSWKIDLAILKKFHKLIEYPDNIRQAAYFIYWMIKTKPIYTEIPVGVTNISDYININERFAFNFAMSYFLEVNISKYPDIFAKFIYLLFYRDVNPKHLILTLKLLLNTIDLQQDVERLSKQSVVDQS